MIHTETIALASAGALQFDAYLARPQTGSGPGLLVCSEMWGVTQSKRELADTYARRGFCALVPNIFWRSEPSGVVGDQGAEREIAWRRLREFDFNRAADDIGRAIAWLRDSPACSGKIASLGFCMGGRIALLAAARHGIEAAISLYALGALEHLEEMKQCKSLLQLHYGLADIHIPMTEIDQVRAVAEGRENIEVWLYPGMGHGFFNPERATHDAGAVALATERIDRVLASLV